MSHKPTIEMSVEADRGLKWRREFERGGTAVGVARARDIKNRKNLSDETVKRMNSYFARHEVDKKAEGFKKGEKGYPSNGRIAWALWGGDAGQVWARSKVKQIGKRAEAQKTILAEADNNKVSEAVEKSLKVKLKVHNERVGDDKRKQTSLNKLKICYNRGIGAYRTNRGSVRPSVKSPEQWAQARVNSYLFALRNLKFRSGKHDTDLLPPSHPMYQKNKKK